MYIVTLGQLFHSQIEATAYWQNVKTCENHFVHAEDITYHQQNSAM